MLQPNELPGTSVDWPAPSWVGTFSSTRLGGVSQGPWNSLNLGAHCGDDAAHVAENRRRVQAHVGRPILWLNQVHGVSVVGDDPGARTALPKPDGQERPLLNGQQPCADAALTRETHHACAILTADCLPLLFCHRQQRVVAAAHAGWRGLAAGVLETTLQAMQVDPGQVLLWLGPAIGPQAFEVGDAVRAAFVQHHPLAAQAFRAGAPGKWWADLPLLARLRAQAAGVGAIFGGTWCTVQEAQRFFSWRRDAGVTGRMGHFIWLRED